MPAPRVPRSAYVLAAAVAVHLALGWSFIRSAGTTFDEPVHLAAGYAGLATGRHRLNIRDHPPLAEMLHAVPLLVLRPALLLDHPDWTSGRLYHYSDVFLHHNRVGARRMLGAARFHGFWIWTLITLGVLWAWARELDGDEAAAAAALVAALSPVLLAHDAVVSTDGGASAFFLASFYFLYKAVRPGASLRWAAACGAAAGCALASKYSMLALPGFLAVVWFFGAPRKDWKVPALAALCAVAVVAAVYRAQLPLYWSGLRYTLGTLQARSSFLLGEHSTTGFALYFPAAFLVKTPLATLTLLALAPFALRGRGKDALWAAGPAVLYFAAALTSKTQIGVRHLLPVFPFVALVAGLAAGALWRRGAAARLGLGALLALQAASLAWAHPHYLTYFNALAGGPRGGYRVLGDSNLDWGQGLPQLAAAVAARGNPPVFLAYFGTDDPHLYGLRYVPAVPNGFAVREGDALPGDDDPVLFAVSATNRQAIYFMDKGIFSWLDGVEPEAVAGNSIFLYDITSRPDALRRLAGLFGAQGLDAPARWLAARASRVPR